MKIGIIIYSETGNTQYVAEKIKEHLLSRGKNTEILLLKAVKNTSAKPLKDPAQVVLENMPNAADYDMLVFGSPVHAFNPAMAFIAYMMRIDGLNNKAVFSYITQALPFAFMGGNALKKIKALTASKGGKIIGEGLIPWGRKNREERILALAEEIAAAASTFKGPEGEDLS